MAKFKEAVEDPLAAVVVHPKEALTARDSSTENEHLRKNENGILRTAVVDDSTNPVATDEPIPREFLREDRARAENRVDPLKVVVAKEAQRMRGDERAKAMRHDARLRIGVVAQCAPQPLKEASYFPVPQKWDGQSGG